MRGRTIFGLAWLAAASLLVPSGARGSVSIYLPPEALAASAPVVLEGTVERVASGYDPVTGAVATYVTLRVAAVDRGPGDLERVVLREPGGRYGPVVHEVDAVPVYRPGEEVVVFAEAARDGALRTAGMFFGKYSILDGERGSRRAMREMSGRGLILRSPPEIMEELSLSDLVALVARTPLRDADARTRAIPLRPIPPEFDRLVWDDPAAPPASGHPALSASSPTQQFVSLSPSYPARWEEADSGIAIAMDVEPARNPLGDAAQAVAEVAHGMAGWTDVPEARISLRVGNADATFTRTSAQSPAMASPASNIVLFGDPYDDLSDPAGCSGTIAFGGYWRSAAPGRMVNGVAFYPIRRSYLIFNRAFECFLGDPRNLAEIAAHELGHGIGLGHSLVPDSIMRAWAYGDRGATLGSDDRDAVGCIYPHTFHLASPNGGESWTGGTLRIITWTSTPETGSDPGTVDLEWSADAGATWRTIAVGARNDGRLPWIVPNESGIRNRVRLVRRPAMPGAFPEICAQNGSSSNFTIRRGIGPAGTSPDGSTGPPLRIGRGPADSLVLTWGASCGSPTGYALYEGTLDALRSGRWDHAPLTCAAGSDLIETVTPGPGDRYYLAAPVAGQAEGSLGTDSAGSARPASGTACATRESSGCR